MYLDCSRGKRPRLATLIGLVEQLAHWKINELELYVENVFTWRRHPQIGRGYSPFTPEELLALQDCCQRHHVRLVGSLASLGHMEKILALPRYRRLGELAGYRGFPGGTMLSPVDPGSIRLVSELYEEFVPLFEAEDFNACLDEPWELGKGRSRRRAERIGAGRVYLEFLRKVHRLCRRHGKRMNAWADIVLDHPEILADLPRDIVMLNWDYNPAGKRIRRTREIADAGLAVMVCPGTNSWQSHGCRLADGHEEHRPLCRRGPGARGRGPAQHRLGRRRPPQHAGREFAQPGLRRRPRLAPPRRPRRRFYGAVLPQHLRRGRPRHGRADPRARPRRRPWAFLI